MESAPTALRARGLSWRPRPSGEDVLRDVDLEIREGESVAVIGPNGAGKTTLLRCLTGLVAPTAGTIEVAGEDGRRLSARQRAVRIAYVPQVRPAAVPLTVADLVLLARYARRRRRTAGPDDEDRRVAAESLERMGLSGLAERRVDELSGGERQTAYIAAAVAQESPILVLDEPTTHLDPKHQRDIALRIGELHRSAKRTVLVATHDLPLAARVSARVLAMRAGRIVGDGRPEDLLSPAALEELFEAPFVVAGGGSRPAPMVDLGA